MTAARRVYLIVTVTGRPGRYFPPAAEMVKEVGVPLAVAARWERERRTLSPAGLKRKLKAQRN